MCTLSWLYTGDELDLFFNRDESLERLEAQPPAIDDDGGVSTLMPIDPVGGGTWLAANDRGLVVALLNNYHHPSRVPPGQAVSRGLLVKRLGKADGIAGVRKILSGEIMDRYPPFFLMAFPGEYTGPVKWEWDGETLKETWHLTGPALSTSSLMPSLVPLLRYYLINRALNRCSVEQSVPRLLSLHRNCRPWPSSVAVAMKRKGRATVSLSHVRVAPGRLTFRYWPGHPSESTSRNPFESHLDLPCSCSSEKESMVSDPSSVTNARQGCPCSNGPIVGPSP